jgi:hypothetical protein
MDAEAQYAFLKNSEWKYLFKIFRYYFRYSNECNIWHSSYEGWAETISDMEQMRDNMDGLEAAVAVYEGAIPHHVDTIKLMIHSIMDHFQAHLFGEFQRLEAEGKTTVKMKFYERGRRRVECHRLFGGVKDVHVCVLFKRIFGVFADVGQFNDSDTDWIMGIPEQFKYKVVIPNPAVPVQLPNGDPAVAIPLTPKPKYLRVELPDGDQAVAVRLPPTPQLMKAYEENLLNRQADDAGSDSERPGEPLLADEPEFDVDDFAGRYPFSAARLQSMLLQMKQMRVSQG